MRDQITATCDVAQPSVRELSRNEIEMIGGGFSWGGLVHKAEAIAHTAIHNIESHDWKQVGNDALNGAKIGAASGGVIGLFAGDPGAGAAYGGAIGTLLGGRLGDRATRGRTGDALIARGNLSVCEVGGVGVLAAWKAARTRIDANGRWVVRPPGLVGIEGLNAGLLIPIKY